MEPEKPDLRQTGLSIKRDWKEYVNALVQPELNVNQRLFNFQYGHPGEFDQDGLPLRHTMEAVSLFYDKLCFIDWPFDLNDSNGMVPLEDSPGAISGRRSILNPLQKRATGSRREYSGTRGFSTVGSKDAYSSEAEDRQSASFEEELLPEHRFIAGVKPVSGASDSQSHQQHVSLVKPPVRELIPEPAHRIENFEKGGLEKPVSEEMQQQERNQTPETLIKETFPFSGTNPDFQLKGIDNQGDIRRDPNVDRQGLFNLLKPEGILENLQQEGENGSYPSSERVVFTPVKTLQSLGAWLQEHPVEENSMIETSPEAFAQIKGSPAQPARFRGFHHETEQTDFFENEQEPKVLRDFSSPPPNFIATQGIGRQDPAIFEDPFHFQPEPSNKPDTEDLIRELTERLNREFKRFYGV